MCASEIDWIVARYEERATEQNVVGEFSSEKPPHSRPNGRDKKEYKNFGPNTKSLISWRATVDEDGHYCFAMVL